MTLRRWTATGGIVNPAGDLVEGLFRREVLTCTWALTVVDEMVRLKLSIGTICEEQIQEPW